MVFDFFKKKEEKIEEKKEERKFERENIQEFLARQQATKKEWSGNKKSFEELEEIDKDKKIINAIKDIKDPELDVDVWTLGLIYDLYIKDNKVDIVMTFTSPTCPYGEEIVNNLISELKEIGFEPKIDIVFNPVWQPSEELKEILGFH